MRELPPNLYREFAEFEPYQAFEAGIPVYAVRLHIEVLEPQVLTSFQTYFLHAIACGVNTRAAIARLLGVNDRDLVAPGASLLKMGYIEQGLPTPEGERPITLTQQGQQALQEHGAPPVPKRKEGKLHFNMLTWSPTPLEEETWTTDQMVKEGLSILPSKSNQRPTLGDFTEKEVASALMGRRAFQGCEVIALLQLKQPMELQYIAPVSVFLLRHREADEQRLAIYRNGVYLRSETAILQRLFESREWRLPADIASLAERGLDIPLSLPSEVTQVTQDLVQREYDLKDLEFQLTGQELLRSTTQNEQERREREEGIQQLREDIQGKQEEIERLRQELRQSQIEFLETEQHRPFLEQALRDAKEEVIIISPWMNRRACNDDLCRLIGEAVGRGVRIRIGYGIGKERDAVETARNQSNLYQVKNAIHRFLPKSSPGLFEMRETHGTHQKILVCDRTFAITGSFNWLSYAGQRDEGYRRETGTLFRQADQVRELATIALQTLSS